MNTNTSPPSEKVTRPGTKSSSVSLGKPSAFPSSQRRASVRSVPRFRETAGDPYSRPFGQRSSFAFRMTSPRKTASELCGREDRLKVSYNLSESGHDATVSLLSFAPGEHHRFQELQHADRLEHLILDDSVSEVMVNGPDQVFVERAGSSSRFAASHSASVHCSLRSKTSRDAWAMTSRKRSLSSIPDCRMAVEWPRSFLPAV